MFYNVGEAIDPKLRPHKLLVKSTCKSEWIQLHMAHDTQVRAQQPVEHMSVTRGQMFELSGKDLRVGRIEEAMTSSQWNAHITAVMEQRKAKGQELHSLSQSFGAPGGQGQVRRMVAAAPATPGLQLPSTASRPEPKAGQKRCAGAFAAHVKLPKVTKSEATGGASYSAPISKPPRVAASPTPTLNPDGFFPFAPASLLPRGSPKSGTNTAPPAGSPGLEHLGIRRRRCYRHRACLTAMWTIDPLQM